ncbi:ATP-binding protein [Saccharopolyspora shandongensis]|uniref:sensor histidine kinase n=1 Tax=Saccharopolyspora shandongensis TaxID=418495 RepID=UPI003438AFDF
MSAEQQRSWLSWWDGSPRSLLFDIAVALAPIAGEIYSHGGRLGDTSLPALAFLTAGFLALLVRRRFPFPAAVVAVLVGLPAGHVRGFVEIALYTVASRRGPRPVTWVTAGVHVLVTGLGMVWWDEVRLGAATSVVMLSVAIPLLLGLWVFGRQRVLADYREHAEQVERERELLAERAVGAQRREIAREMHDVVAHRIGVVSRHAEALAANALDERSAELAEIIRSTSAIAMSELHDMLRALRDDAEAEPATASTTGIADLVDGAVRAGANVRLTMPDPVPDVPPVVGRTAYRVVQEALTNAAKHAPHAAVQVTVTEDGDDLTLTVTNRRSPRAHAVALPSSGFGLVGMRERVALTGGKLHTGRTDDGGYRVHAVLPRHPELNEELPAK